MKREEILSVIEKAILRWQQTYVDFQDDMREAIGVAERLKHNEKIED